MQTGMGFTAAARAETLARLLQGALDVGAGRAFEQAERLAHAVGTDLRRAMVWLREILDYKRVTDLVLMTLGFDRLVVDAARTLVVRHQESVGAYATRVAACHDADLLAVALAWIDDEIRQGGEGQHDTRSAYKEARRVLQRAVDGLANQPPGDPLLPAGGVADNRPTEPALRNALLALVNHTKGAQQAVTEMRGPGNEPWEARELLAPGDLKVFLVNLHALMQVVGLLVICETAEENEDTYKDRMTLLACETKEVPLMEGMATIANMIERRLRDFIESADRGDEPENGTVH